MSRKRPMRHHLQQIAGKCNVSAEHLFGSIYREGLLLIRHEDLSVVSNCAQDAFDIMKIGDNADFFDDARVVLLDVSKIGDALEMMLGEWNYLRKGKVTDMCDTKESGWIEATDACDIKEPCKGSPKTPMCNKIQECLRLVSESSCSEESVVRRFAFSCGRRLEDSLSGWCKP